MLFVTGEVACCRPTPHDNPTSKIDCCVTITGEFVRVAVLQYTRKAHLHQGTHGHLRCLPIGQGHVHQRYARQPTYMQRIMPCPSIANPLPLMTSPWTFSMTMPVP